MEKKLSTAILCDREEHVVKMRGWSLVARAERKLILTMVKISHWKEICSKRNEAVESKLSTADVCR